MSDADIEFLEYALWIGGMMVGLSIFIIDRVTIHARIASDLKGRGSRVLRIQKATVGWGWFTYKSPYIFSVRYLDRQGNEHEAKCEPHLLWGNTWRKDTVIRYAPQNTEIALRQVTQNLQLELDSLTRRYQLEIESLQERKNFLRDEIRRLHEAS